MKFLRSFFRRAEAPAKPAPVAESGPDPVMAALAELELKRLREQLAAVAPPPPAPPPPAEADLPSARPSRVVTQKVPLPDGAQASSVNIWDLEEGDLQPEKPAAPPPPAEPARRRSTRTKTRILGFDTQAAGVVPLFEEPEAPAAEVAPAAPGQGLVMFPTGWLVVKQGPGKGVAFALSKGTNQIGRGSDQTVALDFGDMAISRQNHAAIVYDPATHRFHLAHGGKSTLVRLNGRPLLATETLGDGDELQIGETSLLLKVLCTPDFNWTVSGAGGDGHDMAIA